MAYFPMFVDLTGKNVLVIGGGAVALRKCEKLLPFGCEITAAAGRFLPGFISLPGVKLIFRAVEEGDLEGRDMVIAATDDKSVNRYLAEECRRRRIPVNVVDDEKSCDFLFPALVMRGRLSAGFCTGGASPTASAHFAHEFEESLPDGIEEILEFMAGIRRRVIDYVPDQRRRARIFALLFAAAVEAGGEPDEETVAAIVPELCE